jgi:hypothetical protein
MARPPRFAEKRTKRAERKTKTLAAKYTERNPERKRLTTTATPENKSGKPLGFRPVFTFAFGRGRRG